MKNIDINQVALEMIWAAGKARRQAIRRQMGQYGGAAPEVVVACRCAGCAEAGEPWLEEGTDRVLRGDRKVAKKWTKLHLPKDWHDELLAQVVKGLTDC